MTYACAPALQTAIYARLAGDPVLSDLLGGAVFEAPPAGDVPPIYLSLGPEDVAEMSCKTGRGAIHRLTLSVVSDAASFLVAKQAAAAANDALISAPLTLSRGTVVSVRFDRARARRDRSGAKRRIDLRFRVAVDDT